MTKKILVADDSKGHLAVVDMILSSEGHEVMTVENGHEALRYLQTNTPDLIILDVDMPLMSGIQVCDRLKMVSRLKHVPVMVLTAHRDKETSEAAMFAKADMVMTKPLEGKDFQQVVAKLMKLEPIDERVVVEESIFDTVHRI